MKKLFCILLGLLAGGVFISNAAAQQPSPFYLGAKAIIVDPDFSGFDEAFNIGVVGGYDLYTTPRLILSVEGEFTTTLSDGDISGGGEWDVDTLAVYGVLRTPGEFYVKAKAGFLDQDIKAAGTGVILPGSADDSGFAYGVGGGWRMNRSAALEIEYTAASDDLSFFSVDYVFRF